MILFSQKKYEIKRDKSFNDIFFMKHLWKIILISLIISSVECLAQNKKQLLIDSLQTILKTTSSDTLRVDVFNELAWIYRNNDYEKAYEFGLKAKKLAIKNNDNKRLATSFNRLGLIHKNRGEYTKALVLYNKALTLEQKINHQYGVSRAMNQIGVVLMKTKKYLDAIKYFEKCISILTKLKKPLQIAVKKMNIATCYKNLGNIQKAIKLYLEALEIYQRLNKVNNIGKCYLGLGIIYQRTYNFNFSKKYLIKALNIFEKLNNKRSLAKVYNQLGLIYVGTGNYTKSLDYYEKVLTLKKELGSKRKLQSTYNNLGQVHYHLANYKKSFDFLSKGLEIGIERKDTANIASINNNLGLLRSNEKKYQEAIHYFLNSLKLYKKISEKYNKRDVLKNLSFAYAQVEDYEKAFLYYQQHNTFKDSIETDFRQALQIKDEYETEKKKRELAEKDKKIKETELARLKEYSFRQSLMNYFFGIGFLLSLIIVFAFIRNQQERRKVRKKQGEIEHLLKEQESIALNNMLEGEEKERNRIGQDLHDRLGSMLSVVKLKFEALNQTSQILENESAPQYQQAMQLLDDACDAVRRVSHNISSKTLQRFGLVAALRDLTDHLETNSLKTNLISQGFEDKELPDKYKVQIYRMIQELVGNVLKHARATELAIQLFWRKDQINISVEDNGKGFDTEQTKDVGLGLEGVKFRVKNLNGEFTLDSQPGQGTSILIDIPVQGLLPDQERGVIAM